MSNAKRKDKAPNEQPNLGQEAEEERLGKDKMEHMGDRLHREREKSPRQPHEPQKR
jgi:hypothetical protein